jgi:hypothetical protein
MAGALGAAFCACTLTLPPPPQAADADEFRLLSLRVLRIPVAGAITGAFDKAYAVLQTSNVLERVQQAYAANLPAGQKPEFQVMSAGPGRYYYVNKDDERCDIREIWRETDSNTWFRCAFHVTGERTFGTFETLLYMTVAQQTPEALAYDADIRVWPHGAVIRFILRCLPGVERYFREKTAEMRTTISGVFARLAGPGAAIPPPEQYSANDRPNPV